MKSFSQAGSKEKGLPYGVMSLVDRVWKMHPEAPAAMVMACALEFQVEHLAQLPANGKWMLRFLRELPSCSAQQQDVKVDVQQMLRDDMATCLALRFLSHQGDGDAVYRDAVNISRISRMHLAEKDVCRISLNAYERASRSMVRGKE